MTGPEALVALLFGTLALWGVLVLFVNESEKRRRRAHAAMVAIARRIRFEARLAADLRRRGGEPIRGASEAVGGGSDPDEVPVLIRRK